MQAKNVLPSSQSKMDFRIETLIPDKLRAGNYAFRVEYLRNNFPQVFGIKLFREGTYPVYRG